MHVDDFAVFSNDLRLYREVRDKYFKEFDGEEGPLDYVVGFCRGRDVSDTIVRAHLDGLVIDWSYVGPQMVYGNCGRTYDL